MRKLLFLILLVPVLLFGQTKERVPFETPIFKGEYSEVYEQPLWLEYTIKCPNGSAPRTGMDFYKDTKIWTSDNKDYENNIYDKGHLAPAAGFNCTKEMLYMTFTYLNCVLQDQYLNRGTWRLLEAHERELAKTGDVKVRIDIHFNPKLPELPTGALVPTGFTKTITHKGRVYKYYFVNEKPLSSDFNKYLMNN
jgi:DNA/RNA endonuclease G (NUC1)